MIILPKQKAVFVHIPKTGGDSVSRFLINNVPGAFHSGGGKHWAPWMHTNVPGIHFKFAFVREPVAWYKSFYRFIHNNYIVPNGKYPVFEKGKYHPMRQWEKYDWSSFDTFIECVYGETPAYYTKLVEWMTGPENSRMINYIGKQEELSMHLAFVMSKLSMGHLVVECKKMPHINRSVGKFPISDHTVAMIQKQEHAIYRRFRYEK